MHRPNADVPLKFPGSVPYALGWERTVVVRPVAIGLSVVFCLGLLSVPVIDAWRGDWGAPVQAVRFGAGEVVRALSGDGPWWRRLLKANRAALAGIKNFETAVEDSSAAASAVRPATLDALLRHGGAGSEEAYVGDDGWLFYRRDVDALMRPGGAGKRAPQAIAEFAADLASRGVRLVFMPVPGKASIHPEHLGAGRAFDHPLMPVGWEALQEDVLRAWRSEIAARGLQDARPPVVFDPARVLWSRKQMSRGEQYLATDSHWSPEAMEAVAADLAAVLVAEGAASPVAAFPAPGSIWVSGLGDTARMLELPEGSPLRREQKVVIRPVMGIGGKPWMPDRWGEVVLLGDSYTNIYSSKDLGWGESAGLAEQLSRFLGVPVDRISRNDAGALEARRMLAAAAAKDPAWLRGKKVVVWQLAARELVAGDWSPVAWQDEAAASAGFFVAPPGHAVEVVASVAGVGPVPRPGTTPYADYLTAVHLTDLRDAASGKSLDGESLVYVFTMRGHRLLPEAALSSGQQVRARLSNYGDQAATLDALNRGELDDVDVMLETPNFAQWIEPFRP